MKVFLLYTRTANNRWIALHCNLLAGYFSLCIFWQFQVSSLHVTFPTESEWDKMKEKGFLQRTGMQYHWKNRNYKKWVILGCGNMPSEVEIRIKKWLFCLILFRFNFTALLINWSSCYAEIIAFRVLYIYIHICHSKAISYREFSFKRKVRRGQKERISGGNFSV